MDERSPDAELAVAAADGDRAAFAALYDRYAGPIYDFCASLLRNRDDAADATHDTFVIAARSLGQLRDPGRLRPWLYAIARNEALAHVRTRRRAEPVADVGECAGRGGQPEEHVTREDATRIVWEAAGGLAPRDRALLDLHVRQGLEGDDLAAAMGVRTGTVYTMVNRLKERVARSIGALLVARMARADCHELDEILADWDGAFSPLVRKRVARHVDGCETCSGARDRLASPLALLASVPAIPAPAALRDRVLDGLVNGHAGALPEPRLDRSGFPRAATSTARQVVAAIAIGGVVGAGAVVGVDALSGDGETAVTAPTAPPAVAPGPSTVRELHGEIINLEPEGGDEVETNSIRLVLPLDGTEVSGEWRVVIRLADGGAAINEGTLSGAWDPATNRVSGIATNRTIGPSGQEAGRAATPWSAVVSTTLDKATGSIETSDGPLTFRLDLRPRS